jgi:hypothetical protein
MHTFKFSTCLSPGDPRKSNKYGGNSESRACANSILCPSGIAHSGVVSNSVVMDSCHIRRFMWREEEEMSNLTDDVSYNARSSNVHITEGKIHRCLPG